MEVLDSEHYSKIRKAFIDAIKNAMVEEGKSVDSPAKDWIRSKLRVGAE